MAVLASGSSGNCTLVEGPAGRLLIDCGLSAREAQRRLDLVGCAPRSIDGVVVTHEHGDHVGGAAAFSRRFGAPIYTTAGTAAAAGLTSRRVAGLELFEAGACFVLGGLTVRSFTVPHDAADNVGVVVEHEAARLGYATDLGCCTSLVVERLRECDLLVTEANHDPGMLKDGPYPWSVKQRILSRHGHLSNDQMMEMVRQIVAPRTRHLFLAHLSGTNNRPELARDACRCALEAAGRPGVQVHVAHQWEVSEAVQA